MKQPKWLEKGMKVRFKADPKNPAEHDWVGETFIATVGDSEGDLDGAAEDCYIYSEDNSYWVKWSEVSPLSKEEKPVKIPNKTERKKLAQQVKTAFDILVKEIDAAEGAGLAVEVYLNTDDKDESHVGISYQPPTPPTERYV